MATNSITSIFAKIAKSSDVQVPLMFLILLGLLIVPMPSWVLDFALICNIGLVFVILLRTTSITQPLEMSIFPSILLITTLLRLALNISATRLILGSGDEYGAGQVIHAFGTFVVGANPVIGVIIFVILIIIQFVVITAGAGRVAEVAARFTLDAMPGKQMAIDADLNAGLIDEQEARKRRQTVSREADFYGAMDGASKFVRGDAIAAIMMIIINVLGGFVIGMYFHKMDLATALQQYTMKTVGEGIVTQIPALIMSIATGLIVTRAGSDSNLGQELVGQILGDPRILAICAVILGLFMLVPGLPKFPFMVGAGLLAFMAYKRAKSQETAKAKEATAQSESHAKETAPADDMGLLVIDPIEVEIGYGLIQLADPQQGGELLERITSLRRQIASEVGFLVAPVRVRDNLQQKNTDYVIKLWDVEVAHGEILPRYVLAINTTGNAMELPGAIPTTEPAFGLPALWVPEAHKMDAELAGYTVVDPTTVLITHLSEVVKSHANEVLTRQDVQQMIDNLRSFSPALVDDLVPKTMSLSEVHRVLQNLLKERIPIRDLNRILSTLSDYVGVTRDIDQLTEYVRQSLARVISSHHRSNDGKLDVFTLDPTIEEMMLTNLRPTQFGTQVVMEPTAAQRVLNGVKTQAERAIAMGNQPIALCSAQLRPYLRRFIEKYMPTLTILSHAEIVSGTQIRSSGMVTL